MAPIQVYWGTVYLCYDHKRHNLSSFIHNEKENGLRLHMTYMTCYNRTAGLCVISNSCPHFLSNNKFPDRKISIMCPLTAVIFPLVAYIWFHFRVPFLQEQYPGKQFMGNPCTLGSYLSMVDPWYNCNIKSLGSWIPSLAKTVWYSAYRTYLTDLRHHRPQEHFLTGCTVRWCTLSSWHASNVSSHHKTPFSCVATTLSLN